MLMHRAPTLECHPRWLSYGFGSIRARSAVEASSTSFDSLPGPFFSTGTAGVGFRIRTVDRLSQPTREARR